MYRIYINLYWNCFEGRSITLKVTCKKKYKVKANSERQTLFEATRKDRVNFNEVELINRRTGNE